MPSGFFGARAIASRQPFDRRKGDTPLSETHPRPSGPANYTQDVAVLERVGLIQRKDGKMSVPWERIIAEIGLTA